MSTAVADPAFISYCPAFDVPLANAVAAELTAAGFLVALGDVGL